MPTLAVSEYFYTFLSLCAGILLWKKINSRKRFPPGPWYLPLFGNLLQIRKDPHLRFLKWSKKYGPIFRIKLGTKDVVIVSDPGLIKDLFNDMASTGRMTDNPAVYEFTKGPNGVINSEGTTWQAQRRFTLRTLKDFGFSKPQIIESRILDEAYALIAWFRKSNGQPLPGTRIFNAPVVNSLWRIVTGERCEWERNENRPSILTAAEEFFYAVLKITTNGLFFAPVLRHIAPEYFGWNRYIDSVNGMHDLFNECISKHKETFDPDNLRDFIDHHLREINSTVDSQSSFFKETGHVNMVAGISDLFSGGSETTANTLSWAFLYLSYYQNVQKRLQAEIDQVIGSSSCPSLSNRAAMPYTVAVILEILRMSTVFPLGVPHCMKSDVIFHGYYIPKGTPIFANFYTVHHDPDIWGDPECFRPDRFLNEDQTKVVHHPAFQAFSEGKRQCIGQTLAKDTLFLFIVSIFQQFTVLHDEFDKNGKKSLPDLKPISGFFLTAKPFKVVMLPRNK